MIKEAQLIRIREEDKSRKLLDDGMANPNEQWWWKDATRLLNATWASSPKSVEILQGIVAEAERRGREAAWGEAKNMLIDLLGIGMDESVRFKIEEVDTKLTELKKI